MEPYDQVFQRSQSIIKYLKNELNEEERQELKAWLSAHEDNRRLFEELTNEKALQEELQFFKDISVQHEWEKISRLTDGETRLAVMQAKKGRWWFVAAAAILLLIGSLIVYRLSVYRSDAPVVVRQKSQKPDIAPGGNKAVLTLADGSTIILDDAQNGALTRQGNTKVIKLNGKLAYSSAKSGSTEVVYNTISTPRGGQYQVQLPDGSQVWLNAASSLRFPTAFSGKERRVEITGEAYFEVKKNKAMPFIVRVAQAEVQVLGTHFNVMAYTDEDAVETTLQEGAVKFINASQINVLIPGQQSRLLKNGQVKVLSNVDMDEIISWKNGMFNFKNADIETVMRQLSRWYDVEVVFKSKKAYDPLYAEIPRNTKLSDALKALETAGSAKFEIEGKKIIVSQ